jgi:hypothetical protein
MVAERVGASDDGRGRIDPVKRLALRICLLVLLFAGGAMVNVAVAWLLFPGGGFDWSKVERRVNVDQSELTDHGAPKFDSVDAETLTTFGFLDRSFSTHPAPHLNKYAFEFARATACGWPLLTLQALRWTPLEFDAQTQRHVFSGETQYVSAIPLSERASLLGQREYLPIGPIWPGFLLNTLFYTGVLWLLFTTPGRIRRWRGRRRVRRGLCSKCAYPIGGSDVCSECGASAPSRRGG